MNLENVTRWVLSASAMFCSFEAGHLFYMDRVTAGIFFFAMAAFFLYFSLSARLRGHHGHSGSSAADDDTEDLHKTVEALALLLVEERISEIKQLGRTMPYSSNEISNFETRLSDLLELAKVKNEDKARIAEIFDELKNRARQNEGRRAISQSVRL